MQAAPTPRTVRRIALAVLTVLTATLSPAWAAPAPGRYHAELCVATSAAPPSCGPAQIELRANGKMRVRISDFEYRLQLNSSQVDVVLMHGTMQVDEFFGASEWVGNSLRFADRDKNTRYELRLGKRQAARQTARQAAAQPSK